MELNLVGTLTLCKAMNIIPNYSELSRIFKKDRHTIKKMYEGKENCIRKKKPSMLDKYRDEIIERLSMKYVRIKSVYWYFKNEKNISCTYDNFKTYVRKNNLRGLAIKGTPHPLYETDPGDTIQNDWVEDITLSYTNGEKITFNLYSATFGYSRFHYFEYSDFKDESTYKTCTIHLLEKIGGIPKRILTDNMSALVSIKDSKRIIHPSVIQFFKDLDIKLEFCKVRSPETKGKDETSNKFANWLYAYDGKIKDKNDLLRLIKKLNKDINNQVNTRTNVPPVLLFQKEKEYLRPLPNKYLLDSYKESFGFSKVPSTFLIDYRGSKYSVPPYLINKTVKFKEENDFLYIYYSNDLVSKHKLVSKGQIIYNENHYKNGISHHFKNTEDIDEITKKNLERFKGFNEK